MKYDHEKMKKATTMFLEAIGEDVSREGILETPERVAKMYGKLLNGYDENVEEHVKLFDAEGSKMVTLGPVRFYSYCEHHLQLFTGHIYMCYIPKDKIVGISKLVRIARVFCKRLQVQERLTNQIADALDKALKPEGCAVMIRSQHFCMNLRGVQTPGSIMTTTEVRGLLKEDLKAREEFLKTVEYNTDVFSY